LALPAAFVIPLASKRKSAVLERRGTRAAPAWFVHAGASRVERWLRRVNRGRSRLAARRGHCCKERIMMRMSRRKGAVSIVLMSLFIGVAGCLNSANDERPFLQSNVNGYPSYPPMNGSGANMAGVPLQYGNTGMTPAGAVAASPNGGLVRAQFTQMP